MSNFELSILFFLQATVILVACRVVGWIGSYLRQPQVVCEMIAGVLLGPSLLGLLAPAVSVSLFPRGGPSMAIIYAIAQIGLVLYMFLVGVEFRAELLRDRIRAAASVSIAGMLVPFTLGAALVLVVHQGWGLFTPGVGLGQAMLYFGAAMSITAFPMLARIIVERGIAGTRLGTLALSAGSIDDAAAWCVLAIVLASFKSSPQIAALAIGGGVAYITVMVVAGRPLLRLLGTAAERVGNITPTMLAIALSLLMLSAWFTDFVGIYAVFGAFILGAVMPRGLLAERLVEKIEPLTTNLLLPMFFVYSGLNTRIDLMNSPALWAIAGLVLLAACVGKGAACYAAARLSGESHRDGLAIGALMNARGLMELIILNIGLERGLITPELFTIMVFMAIVTTLMASPLFLWAYPVGTRPK